MQIITKNHAPDNDTLDIQIFEKARDDNPAVNITIYRTKDGEVYILISGSGESWKFILGK